MVEEISSATKLILLICNCANMNRNEFTFHNSLIDPIKSFHFNPINMSSSSSSSSSSLRTTCAFDSGIRFRVVNKDCTEYAPPKGEDVVLKVKAKPVEIEQKKADNPAPSPTKPTESNDKELQIARDYPIEHMLRMPGEITSGVAKETGIPFTNNAVADDMLYSFHNQMNQTFCFTKTGALVHTKERLEIIENWFNHSYELVGLLCGLSLGEMHFKFDGEDALSSNKLKLQHMYSVCYVALQKLAACQNQKILIA